MVSLSQERHITKLAAEHGLTDCKPIHSPAETGLQLQPAASPDLSLPFRNLIGALLFARATRPDILYIVIYLSRFSTSYDSSHFKAAKRVLRSKILGRFFFFRDRGLFGGWRCGVDIVELVVVVVVLACGTGAVDGRGVAGGRGRGRGGAGDRGRGRGFALGRIGGRGDGGTCALHPVKP